jgi:hypothetical protein
MDPPCHGQVFAAIAKHVSCKVGVHIFKDEWNVDTMRTVRSERAAGYSSRIGYR